MSSEQHAAEIGLGQAITQINKLQKENEEYKKQRTESWTNMNRECDRLKGQIDELKSECFDLKEDHKTQFQDNLRQYEQIRQLTYDIEQLELNQEK